MILKELKEIKAVPKELRKFAWIFTAIFFVVGIARFFHGRGGVLYLSALALAFFFVGWFRPLWLRPFYYLWMGLAVLLGSVVSRLLLILLFYLVITPIGLLYRLSGRSFVKKNAKSYWIPKEVSSFDPKKYEQQF